MNAIIYFGRNEKPKDFPAIINLLHIVAKKKGWNVEGVVEEAVFAPDDTSDLKEYYQEHDSLYEFLNQNQIEKAIIMVKDVQDLGNNLPSILTFVKEMHESNRSVYLEAYDILSYENGQESGTFNFFLNMLSQGSDVEISHRNFLQRNGIEKAKLEGKYKGRLKGAKADPEKLKRKYNEIINLLNASLTIREISERTHYSINTVRKIRDLIHK
ncbi:MAG TPA: hypothetical protein VK179_10830 [Bacteroidales bacterium]|nr:hypothetical protein [Bacteroidales bacterium]